MPVKTRTRVTYSGRVQGVGFRLTARSLAHGRPLTGWVRNDANGSVVLEVQGVPSDVESLLQAVRERMGRLILSEAQSGAELVDGESSFVIRP